MNSGALNGKDLGLIECPNLKTMCDTTTGTTKTVMFFGANGYNYGQTSGSYYMVGTLMIMVYLLLNSNQSVLMMVQIIMLVTIFKHRITRIYCQLVG